jgi:hypothetical protein
MANDHQSTGVNESNRNKTVVASAPASPSQAARAAATAVTVPFAYASGPKFGSP